MTKLTDKDIWLTAGGIINEFGEQAELHAAARANALKMQGDQEGEQVWLQILAAVIKLHSFQPPRPVH